MSKRRAFLACLLLPTLMLTACSSNMRPLPPELASDPPVVGPSWPTDKTSKKSATAFMEAVQSNKHFFVYCHKSGKPTKADMAARAVFDGVVQRMPDAIRPFVLNVKDREEAAFVKRFSLDKAPLPLVLVLAPNGAIVGGFPKDKITEQGLMNSIASRNFQRALRALQGGNLLVVYAVPGGPPKKKGPLVPLGVLEFATDPQYNNTIRVVVADPNDPAESGWMTPLRPATGGEYAFTCMMVPPGSVIATLQGEVTKQQMADALKKALSRNGIRFRGPTDEKGKLQGGTNPAPKPAAAKVPAPKK